MLVGFRPRNHPTQVRARGARDDVDDRGTPVWLFELAQRRIGQRFTLDAAAALHNAKCRRFFDRKTNGLKRSWAGEIVWCNPPFSDLASWVAKAMHESERGCTIVMLLPANRTEQGWWQRHIEPNRIGGVGKDGTINVDDRGVSVAFIGKRVQFVGKTGRAVRSRDGGASPPFGCCLVTFTKPKKARRS